MAEAEKQSEKRLRILEGALRAFAKKGYYNTKVSEIANEAGVADGTIYLYFKNKDDLLISLFEDRMEYLIQRLNTELEPVNGSVERLREVFHLHFRLAIEEPDLAEFITVELRQSAKFVKEYKNRKFYDYLSLVEGLIEEAQAEGKVRKDLDRRIIARAMFGALDEILLQLTLSHSDIDIKSLADQVGEVFIEGIVSRSAS